jgi:hypothetical protein
MKFTATSVLALALGAQASNVARDLATIQGVISGIQTQTQALDTAVNAYTGDFGPVQSAATALQNLIVSGTSTVNAQPVLDLLDASQIASTVTGLSGVVNTTVNDLIAKTSTFVANGKAADVLQTLQAQKTASQALADALTSKVPADLQTVAAELSAAISDALTRGITAFTGLGSGPTSSSSAVSSTPAAPTSSTTASSVSSTGGAVPTSTASSSSGWATSSSKTHTGHGSKTLSGTGGVTSSATATWSSPALSSSAPATKTGTTTSLPVYTGAAVARGFNGALAIAAAAALMF